MKRPSKYDFAGWATKVNVKCADGRTIMHDAFKDDDGKKVPLVWQHQHDTPDNVLGHAILENRKDGVYAYGYFNDLEGGKLAKVLVEHGDVSALSIYANQLREHAGDVVHGVIREVSLVLAGANPEARIEDVLCHDEESGEAAVIRFVDNDSELSLYHSDDDKKETKEDKSVNEDEKKEVKDNDEETVADVFNTLTEKQKKVVSYIVGSALENATDKKDDDDSDEGGEEVKHNIFEQDRKDEKNTLTHSDQTAILTAARNAKASSLKDVIKAYVEDNKASLAHGIDDIDTLFPEYKDLRPGAPELITRDQTWVSHVMDKTNKIPFTRVRTRQADVRGDDLRAYGYVKGDEKVAPGNIKLLKRTTDPQTVYRVDSLERDDIIDITDFDVVDFQYQVMKQNLEEELSLAIMVGDGREDGDQHKISEEHIRSIWHDDDLYCIHYDVDLDAAEAELQGSNTSANFGENYIYAEAIITAALYSREQYKGSGSVDFYCTPHLLNVMLLARDLNGRRIYDSATDLAKALNVGAIHTAEQFEGLTRTDSDGNTKELLGIFVNLSDYSIGHTKGGEITKFEDFDIDFNQYKYMIETRLSGALTRVYSAIALELPQTTTSDDDAA